MNFTEIRELRIKSKWTQAQFANRLGVTVCTVNRWESGKVSPSALAIEKINQIKQAHNERLTIC